MRWGFELVEDLEANYNTIKRLVKECYSFNMYKDGQGEVIYEAPKKMTKEQIEKNYGTQ